MEQLLSKLVTNKKNYVLIGEAGSGKTELAINLACAFARFKDRQIHLFDMDQTKPVLRARDVAQILKQEHVVFHYQKQLLDTPTVAPGVKEALMNPAHTVLLDIGGGSHGSHMIGQFAEFLNNNETEVLYLINPYRPWSRGRADIEETMQRVLATAGLNAFSIVANPNIGRMTTVEAIVNGVKAVQKMFPEYAISFACAMESLLPVVQERLPIPVFGLHLCTMPEWF